MTYLNRTQYPFTNTVLISITKKNNSHEYQKTKIYEYPVNWNVILIPVTIDTLDIGINIHWFNLKRKHISKYSTLSEYNDNWIT